MTEKFDLIVLGGGPGGYVAAIRAAQLGRRVAVVDDQEYPGGVCTNWGCIPTKALLDAARRYEVLKDAEALGFRTGPVSFEMKTIVEHSRQVVSRLGKGVIGLLEKNKVERLAGRGQIVLPGRVKVGDRIFETDRTIVATGSRPRLFPGMEPDGERVWTSREALLAKEAPRSLVVLGAGAIGMEFAYFFHTFGTKVTVVEMLDRILPNEDPDVSNRLRMIYERRGMSFHLGRPVRSLERSAGSVRVEIDGGEAVEADVALVALGVVPNDEGLLGDGIVLQRDGKGWIAVDDDYRTSLPGIHAIGDVTGPPWLAHVASHEGVVCVERMYTDERPSIDYEAVPGCTYCAPQVASVGLTEPEARRRHGADLKVGVFPFQAIGRAVAAGETAGFVKILFAGPHDQLVGAHILGAEATEIIAELGIAYAMEATADEIIGTMHAHPTLAEAVLEATLAARGRAIHI